MHYIKYKFINIYNDARFEVFTTMNIQVVVFCVMTPSNDMVGYQRFGGTGCLHLQGEVNVEEA
jgi:hypothetical protein